MTSVAGAINGSLAAQNHGGFWNKYTKKVQFNPSGWWINSFKLCIWAQNLFVS